jgi:transglutaminase-like putative cysteine protease/tetratricopeptide (TPR) repeat protein
MYGPAPAWVTRATLPPVASGADAPPILLFDSQQRIEGEMLHVYMDMASRAATPETLSQLASLSLPWMPDKGDLTIHELSIQRGAERIDLLAKGQRFTVLRREESMEQRELTGLLTATLPVEGLQIGDVLRLSTSMTIKDPALKGRVDSVVPVLVEPARAGFARMRVSWPKDQPTRWKLLASGITAKPQTRDGYTELEIALPAPKLAELPGDAPVRFRPLPLLETSTFQSWEEVSRTMAPLYATDGLIAEASPLAAEVAAIMKAEPSPAGRAARALRVVQDQVRYLAVLMNGGNHVPQSPARSWDLRYGDCKAKSLLLLAMLKAMGIEAEPVLVSTQLGDWLPQRLPSAAAFDHVIVRAVVDGRAMWLDGTRTGTRLPDIWDTPALRHALPLRQDGAALISIDLRNDARPLIDLSLEADESSSADLPSIVNVSATYRGDLAGRLGTANQLGPQQRRELAQALLGTFLGEAQFADIVFRSDEEAGTVTLSARAATTTPWRMVDRRLRREAFKLSGQIEFAPDRGRPAWAAMPVGIHGPFAIRWRTRLRLPEGGRGYVLEGDPGFTGRVAGHDVARSTVLSEGIVTIEERIDQTGREVGVADIAAEREKLAALKTRAPRLVAPADARRRWDVATNEAAASTQVAAIEALFAKAIADKPDEVTGYTSRAQFRRGIGNRAGAIADFTRALAIAPTVDLNLSRAWLHRATGNLAAAQSDAEAARTLDPSSVDANIVLADVRAERGDLSGALLLLDERVAMGGETRTDYRKAKADVLGQFGDPAEAIRILDAVVEEKPGSPSLLNARCWIKATRSVMLDSALKDCTSAVELSDVTAGSLDSRAVVWFRLGRYDDALRDLDAALAQAPGQAASLFMRAVVLGKLSRSEEGRRDLAVARRLDPRIDVEYARYGIKP